MQLKIPVVNEVSYRAGILAYVRKRHSAEMGCGFFLEEDTWLLAAVFLTIGAN